MTAAIDRAYIIGFRGIGLHRHFTREPLLIRVGHVGISLDDGQTIYGFRPVILKNQVFGGSLLTFLRERNAIRGALFDDTAIFERAHMLSRQRLPTTVWQIGIVLDRYRFGALRHQLESYYMRPPLLWYSFPPKKGDMPPQTNNCVTFLRKLTLPFPEPNGHIAAFVNKLALEDDEWRSR